MQHVDFFFSSRNSASDRGVASTFFLPDRLGKRCLAWAAPPLVFHGPRSGPAAPAVRDTTLMNHRTIQTLPHHASPTSWPCLPSPSRNLPAPVPVPAPATVPRPAWSHWPVSCVDHESSNVTGRNRRVRAVAKLAETASTQSRAGSQPLRDEM
jgi:hypothetical protein